jgi:hypothetical protein
VIRLSWPLGAGLVGVDRREVAEHGIDDGPGGVDAVGARGNVHAGPARISTSATNGGTIGEQFLEGLRNTKRQLWLEGKRVNDVTTSHPALAGLAQT